MAVHVPFKMVPLGETFAAVVAKEFATCQVLHGMAMVEMYLAGPADRRTVFPLGIWSVHDLQKIANIGVS